MIYLDYAATTPVDLVVQATIGHALAESYGNPSATYQLGKNVKTKLLQARQQLRDFLQVPEGGQVYFTSGATEAINWAITSQAHQARQLNKGNHIVTTSIEHSAVNKTLAQLEKQGFQVTRIQPNPETKQFSLDQFIQATTNQTIGWTAMAVNNETGSQLPIKELGLYAKEHDLWFHVDATQAVGYQSTSFEDLPCTSYCGSGHKFYAPKGIGFLVYQPWQENMPLEPLLVGGGQEYNMRAGTENIPYIIGMVQAVKLMDQLRTELQETFQDLTQYFFQQLDQAGLDYQRNGDIKNHNHRIHNIWLKGQLASQVLIKLDLQEIYISAGSACSAGSIKPSRVLKAYYPDNEALWGQSLRISFGKYTTKKEIDSLVQALKDINQSKEE